MTPLYNRKGRVVGWLENDGGRILDLRGGNWLWRQKGNVYDYAGAHKGWWRDGHWRSHDGGVIAFRAGAQNLGVIPPIPAIPPVPPIPSIPKIPPIPSIPPIPPIPKLAWSNDTVL
jgi:hypothetical protein